MMAKYWNYDRSCMYEIPIIYIMQQIYI